MLTEALERARRLRPVDGKLPHVTGDDGRWQLLSPVEPEREALTGLPWTGGFVAGQLRLAGEHEAAVEVDRLLAPRAEQPTTHDLGFLFWTADDELRTRAADTLARRALPSGVIQVIGELDDPALHGRTIVDTWPNLRLLPAEAAQAHLDATLDVLLRPDGSTFHAARIADDGSVLERGTINGAADDSTWARGQAWAILGLAGCGYRAGPSAPRAGSSTTCRTTASRPGTSTRPGRGTRLPPRLPRRLSSSSAGTMRPGGSSTLSSRA